MPPNRPIAIRSALILGSTSARVHDLHHSLGYPRTPLVHVFFAERLTDAVAVAGWLLLLALSS